VDRGGRPTVGWMPATGICLAAAGLPGIDWQAGGQIAPDVRAVSLLLGAYRDLLDADQAWGPLESS